MPEFEKIIVSDESEVSPAYRYLVVWRHRPSKQWGARLIDSKLAQAETVNALKQDSDRIDRIYIADLESL